MITKIGAAVVSSAVKPAKYQQIQPVQPAEQKPITPTTQTQDVANNIRGLSQGYDSREGFNRPNQNTFSGNNARNNSMITKIGNEILEKDAFLSTAAGWLGKTLANTGSAVGHGIAGSAKMLGHGMEGFMKGFSTGRNARIMGPQLPGKGGMFTGIGTGLKTGYTEMAKNMNGIWKNMSTGAKATAGLLGAGTLGYMGFGGGSDAPTYNYNYNFSQPQNQQYMGSWQ